MDMKCSLCGMPHMVSVEDFQQGFLLVCSECSHRLEGMPVGSTWYTIMGKDYAEYVAHQYSHDSVQTSEGCNGNK
jgi:DNA-directed RNA polymerase subunit RPC12/RpoP